MSNSIDVIGLISQKGPENVKFIKSEKEFLEEFGTPCLVHERGNKVG